MTASIRVRYSSLAFRRNQRFSFSLLVIPPNEYSRRQISLSRKKEIMSSSYKCLELRRAKESESSVSQARRNSGLTSWNSTRFIGSTQTFAHTRTHVTALICVRGAFALVRFCARSRRSCIDVYEQVAWHKSRIVRIAWRLPTIRQTTRRTIEKSCPRSRPAATSSSSRGACRSLAVCRRDPSYRELNSWV